MSPTKEEGRVSQRIFQPAPSMPLEEHQGLFLKTLPSSRFRSTACKWKVWDFAIDLNGVEQVLLIKSFFILMQGTEEGEKSRKDYLPGWTSLRLLGLPFLVLPCFLVFVNVVLIIKVNIY